MTRPTRRSSLDTLAAIAATAGGAGLVPAMPGTAGALVGVGICVILARAGLFSLYLPLLAALTVIGVWAAGRVEVFYGHDASRIVIDEVVGQMIALGFVGARDGGFRVGTVILGFLLFRFFDILKPFPIRRLERFRGGIGVMADDIGAGICAALVLLVTEPLLEML